MIFACGLCGGGFESAAVALAGAFAVVLPYVHDRARLAVRKAQREALARTLAGAIVEQPARPIVLADREPRRGREAVCVAILERSAS